MKAKFSIKVAQKNMYNFMMYYAYHGVSGIFSIVAAAALLGLAVWSGTHKGENTWLYALFGVLFAVYQPWTLFIHSAKQVTSNPVFKKPLVYEVNEAGIMCGRMTRKMKFPGVL